MSTLEYDCNFNDAKRYTHYLSDGELGYWTEAPGWTLQQIAEDFASDYSFADEEDTEFYIVASVGTMPEETADHYFAFNAEGDFEWDTERQGGARGY